jgi:hypothetical protein
MSEGTTKSALRRKSSGIAALMTLNCNNIPTINEPTSASINTENSNLNVDKKKSLRFDTSPYTSEYDPEEIKEVKRRITDEIKK